MKFTYKQLNRATNRFTVDLSTLTDGELLRMWRPDDLFFRQFESLIPRLHPKDQQEARRQYAYLKHLDVLQAMAWGRVVARLEKQLEELKQQIETITITL